MRKPEAHCKVTCGEDDFAILNCIRSMLPDCKPKRIFIKPNWVQHESDRDFPISALVTSPRVLRLVVEACIERYRSAQVITVGDVPLQNCDWNLLYTQAGIDVLDQTFKQYRTPEIRFLDLRRERFRTINGFHVADNGSGHGDPEGYREVALDSESFLNPISSAANRFRVADYDSELTMSAHRRGRHRYLVSGSALKADLFVNVPKAKTHQKAGVTGALKNLVGLNGEKAYLVHFRRGKCGSGGDEFPPDIFWATFVQSEVRGLLQKRSRTLFRLARPFWRALKGITGVQTKGDRASLNGRFYVGGGAWFGNDSIWRMVYDLNKIVLNADGNGKMTDSRQREYVTITDGLVAGEGNGPLQPLPVPWQRIICSNDAFLSDVVMAEMMGFDCAKIPLLRNMSLFGDELWGKWDITGVPIEVDGIMRHGIESVPVSHRFLPPPGWRTHIEEKCAS